MGFPWKTLSQVNSKTTHTIVMNQNIIIDKKEKQEKNVFSAALRFFILKYNFKNTLYTIFKSSFGLYLLLCSKRRDKRIRRHIFKNVIFLRF